MIFWLPFLPFLYAKSVDSTQTAASDFVFFLQAPGNCETVASDMPLNATSKNLAALWIRAAFHDMVTYDALSQTGGADGSLLGFLDYPDNAGLADAMPRRFVNSAGVKMSNADMITLSAIVSVYHCGGPRVKFYPGRLDAPKAKQTSPDGFIPHGTEDFSTVKAKMIRMGFNKEDIVALVTGSHSMGGVHGASSPAITKETFVASDDTPGLFDNNVFQKTLNGFCAIPVDCDIAKDTELRPIVQLYANDQDAFFKQYAISFEKLNNMTTSTLGPEAPFTIPIHNFAADHKSQKISSDESKSFRLLSALWILFFALYFQLF